MKLVMAELHLPKGKAQPWRCSWQQREDQPHQAGPSFLQLWLPPRSPQVAELLSLFPASQLKVIEEDTSNI